MYRTKEDFMEALEKELVRLGITDKSEIIADFELHFADSTAQNLSEAEICAKLGSISEIAKQYAEDEIYPVVAVETTPSASPPPLHGGESPPPQQEEPQNNIPPPQSNTDYENSGIRFNKSNSNIDWGGLIAVICIDIFVLIWAIPALGGIIFGLLAVPFSLVVSGLVIMIGGIFSTGFLGFQSPLPGLVTFFLGLMLLSLGGLFGLLGVQLIKLFVKLVKIIIDWHGKMITGKPVFKKQQEVSA